MSRMNKVNLDLQEQANELGFSTVQSAIDNGCRLMYDHNGLANLYQSDEAAMLDAHQAWLVEKETIINKLEMLIQDTNIQVYKDTLREAIDFIEKGEV